MDEPLHGPASRHSGDAPLPPARRRLLILGCSGRQRSDPSPLPAITRYDGPSFRVLRRYLGQTPLAGLPLTVFVLSAEHGLISGDLSILPYNRTMTAQRASELEPQVVHQWADHTATALAGSSGQLAPADLLIGCTRAYVPALSGLEEQLLAGSTVQMAPFRPGERLACLHDWLHGHPPQLATVTAATVRMVTLCLRGVEATLSGQGLLARAQSAMLQQEPAARVPTTWAVDLNGGLVSPKWLVSIGFGLSPSAFGTSDALRVLAALGITACRLPG